MKSTNKHIILSNIHIAINGKTLIQNIDKLKITYPHKYGVIGNNGIGKSTLFRQFASKELEFDYDPKVKIVYIEQEIPSSNDKPLDIIINDKLKLYNTLLEEENRLLSSDEFNEDELKDLYDKIADLDIDKIKNDATNLLIGLGFNQNDITTKPISKYSGGWRMRLSIAKGLFEEPDILILDEPNNHLDLKTLVWLENYLSNWKHTLVVISHDTSFLDEFIDRLIIFEGSTPNINVVQTKGNYNNYRSKLKKSNKYSLQIENRIKSIPLKFKDVSFQYSDNSPFLFENLEFGIDLNDRIAILGNNGTGKSTLLNLISGDLLPTSGEIDRNHKLKIIKYHQHQIDKLDLTKTAVEYFISQYNMKELEIRKYLAKFGLTKELPIQLISTLSGGEKARLAIAELCIYNPHILLLDEPTNHLDIDGINALIACLNGFNGGIILVSHNQYLIEELGCRLWILENKTLISSDLSFRDYKYSLLND